jgi:hypothetical protein
MADWNECKLDPLILLALGMKGESPCDRCNHNRSQCNGTPNVEK